MHAQRLVFRTTLKHRRTSLVNKMLVINLFLQCPFYFLSKKLLDQSLIYSLDNSVGYTIVKFENISLYVLKQLR